MFLYIVAAVLIELGIITKTLYVHTKEKDKDNFKKNVIREIITTNIAIVIIFIVLLIVKLSN